MRAVRNIAIIVVLALAISVLPAGGNLARGILLALSLLFIAAIGLMIVRFWRQLSFTIDTLTDRQRWLLYGSLGAIALMIAGLDEMLSTGVGTVVWLAIVALSGWLIVTTWRETRSV